MAYLLDANVFVQAKNLHYGFDFCPAFWDWLLESNAAASVFSIERVGDELQAGADIFAEWAKQQGSDFFLPPDQSILPALTTVSTWAAGQGYAPAAVNTFLRVADYYLVAHALAHTVTIVTHEIPAQTVNKIKIPNACIALGIKCVINAAKRSSIQVQQTDGSIQARPRPIITHLVKFFRRHDQPFQSGNDFPGRLQDERACVHSHHCRTYGPASYNTLEECHD